MLKSVYSTSPENIRFLVLGRRYLELNALDTYAGESGKPVKADLWLATNAVFIADKALTKIRQLPPGRRPQSNPYQEYEVVRKMLRGVGLSELLNREDAQHALNALGARYPKGPDKKTPRPVSAPRLHPGQSTSASGSDNTKSSYYNTGSSWGRVAKMAKGFSRGNPQSAKPGIEYRTPVKKPLWDSLGRRLCSSLKVDYRQPAMEPLVERRHRSLSCGAERENSE